MIKKVALKFLSVMWANNLKVFIDKSKQIYSRFSVSNYGSKKKL